MDLTADTRIGSRDGTFTGVLVARATEGGESVRTSFGVRREAEAYDLTLKYLGTDGRPSQSGTLVLGRNVDFLLNAYDTEGDGIVRTRVPRGTYLLETPVLTRKGARATPDTALMVQPELSVTKATTVTFDARRAKPVNFTVPQGAKSVDTYLKYVLESDDTTYGSVWQHDSFKGFRTGHVGAALPAKEFSSHIGGTWQKGSTTYNLHYDRASSLHTGLVHKVTGHELALVKNRIGASAKKRTGAVSPSWETATGVGHETVSKPFALPATANTYVNTRKGVKWGFSAGQNRAGSGDDGLEIVFNEPNLKTYLKGKTYSQTFNVGVFSPKINTYNTARRMGDDLSFCIGEYTDGAGHVGLSTVTKQRTRVTVDGKRLLSSEGGSARTPSACRRRVRSTGSARTRPAPPRSPASPPAWSPPGPSAPGRPRPTTTRCSPLLGPLRPEARPVQQGRGRQEAHRSAHPPGTGGEEPEVPVRAGLLQRWQELVQGPGPQQEGQADPLSQPPQEGHLGLPQGETRRQAGQLLPGHRREGVPAQVAGSTATHQRTPRPAREAPGRDAADGRYDTACPLPRAMTPLCDTV